MGRKYTPFDRYDRYFRDFYAPPTFRPMNDIMREMNEIFKNLMNDDSTAESMENLSKDESKSSLKATVTRNGRQYEIVIRDVTEPKPDEVTSFEWVEDFGEHEDLTE
jgi:hypothetical protein